MQTIWEILKASVHGFVADHGLRLAASLAFYTILSLMPLLVILLAIIGAVAGAEAGAEQLGAEVQYLVGGPAAEALRNVIQQAQKSQGRSSAAFLSVALLLLSATAVFAQLQDSLNHMFNVPPKKRPSWMKLVRARLIAIVMLAGLAALALGLVLVSSALEFIVRTASNIHPLLKFLGPVIDWSLALAVFIGLFAAIFKLVPDTHVPWRAVQVGATVTGVLFAVGRELISVVLARNSAGTAYGAAGSLIVILLWIYYSSVILFFGAEFTQAVAERVRANTAKDEGVAGTATAG